MRKIKSFSLFESSDTLDILPVVKDMLLELSDLDYVTNCVIRRMDSREFIRIGIVKPVVMIDRYDVKASFEWSDIKDIMDTIIEYLKSEGYHYRTDKGTSSEFGQPIVITSGNAIRVSNSYEGIKSRCEMWFEKI